MLSVLVFQCLLKKLQLIQSYEIISITCAHSLVVHLILPCPGHILGLIQIASLAWIHVGVLQYPLSTDRHQMLNLKST